MLLENLPKSASLPVATSQETKRRIREGIWDFDYIFYTESDQVCEWVVYLVLRSPWGVLLVSEWWLVVRLVVFSVYHAQCYIMLYRSLL
jgi:hypothetical protein